MKPLSSKQMFVRLFLFLVLAGSAYSLPENVDPGFNPILTRTLVDDYDGFVATQPDGKLLVWGSARYFQRLNPDGSVDPTFDCVACRGVTVQAAAVQTDGKIIIVGSNFVIRVHTDGKLDRSFKATGVGFCFAKIVFSLADNKSFVYCDQAGIKRLNSNGSVDPTFTEISLGASKRLAQMAVLPDGKVLMGGDFTSGSTGWIERYNADGSLDGTFTASPSSYVSGIGVLADGRYLVTGAFSTINGVFKPRIARLNTDGSVDTSFTAPVAQSDLAQTVRPLPNGQFYVRMRHSFFPTPTPDSYRYVRYNTDGSVDNTFAETFAIRSFSWDIDPQGRIVTFRDGAPATRFYRLNFDGSIDNTFVPVIKIHAGVTAAAIQNDGKILVAGPFVEANGASVIRFTRLNPDGTNDPTFNSGTGFDIPPDKLAIQADGKILAIGSFTGYNFFARPKIVRINADGSADTSFAPVVDGTVNAITQLSNGKILLGGTFTTVNGTPRKAVARLNSDGTLDGSFNPTFSFSLARTYTIFVHADGRFLLGGAFGTVDGHSSSGTVRFNSDGSVDTGFVASTDNVNNIALRPDGKYVVTEWNEGGNDPSQIYRINSNGSRDWSFAPRTTGTGGFIYSLLQQPSGNILYGGIFSGFIERIGPNGQNDIFFPTYGANNRVTTMFNQPDGKVIVAGLFSGIEDLGRYGIARLMLSNRLRGAMFDYDGDARSDVSVYRPSTNTWYEILSADGSIGIQTFGAAGDLITPADYDGDGKTDIGLFRPSIGDWLYVESSANTFVQRHWGQMGDVPMPGDFDANGTMDLVVYRPSTGTWFGTAGGAFDFGAPGDQPLSGDFDGDGRTDRAVFRPSTGDWWYAASSTPLLEFRQAHWGANGDLPVPADYDGDGKTDYGVFRPSDGGWYINNSSDGSFTILAFGTNGDRPSPGDYDGDGRTDIAVFRPSTGIWYLYRTTAGFAGLQFGVSGDIPTPNAYVP